MTATKHDSEKPRMDLLSSRWLIGVAKVLTFGARKYEANNWRKGHKASQLIGAAMRHLAAFNDGENTDSESGLSHLYHASCCLMFLAENMEVRPEFDDRWKDPKKDDGGYSSLGGWAAPIKSINDIEKQYGRPAPLPPSGKTDEETIKSLIVTDHTFALESCPFCNSINIDIIRSVETWVLCLDCKASTDSKTEIDKAVEIWNRRA